MIESEVSAPSILWLSHGATSFPFSAFAIVPGVPVSTSVDTGSGGPWAQIPGSSTSYLPSPTGLSLVLIKDVPATKCSMWPAQLCVSELSVRTSC